MSDPAVPSVITQSSSRRLFLRTVLNRSRCAGAVSLWLLVATGLLLRVTVRDRIHPFSLIYYLTPLPAVAIWLLLAGLLWGRPATGVSPRSRLSLLRISLAASLIFVFLTLRYDYVRRALPVQGGDRPCLFWNTARAAVGVEPLASRIRQWNPDLLGLVETNSYYSTTFAEWQEKLPGYTVRKTHFGGLLALKGDVQRQISHSLAPTSWCEQFDVQVGHDAMTILLVDISATLSLSRRQPLIELAELVQQLSDRPVVVMGDFNTPDDSVLLEPLRNACRPAFREFGYGYAPTWPMPLPVLTLDQVWINDRVQVSRCEHRSTLCSDHRPVSFQISIPAATARD